MDLAACHHVIERLRGELADVRRRLAVHEENQRRELERRYGKGTTAADLLSFGQPMARPPSKSRRAAIKAELAAEDAQREAEEADLEARWQAARRRDKKL
jgi:hypothetical protein